MTPAADLELLRTLARRHGFTWSEAMLQALAPQLEWALEALAALERIDPGPEDPAVQYRLE
ncbi:MAG TPA: hypothetical protein VNO23_12825 [Candidatus Binatia bacterium]|nr:hypothetical protein [Candidatus Binatia bacterium]